VRTAQGGKLFIVRLAHSDAGNNGRCALAARERAGERERERERKRESERERERERERNREGGREREAERARERGKEGGREREAESVTAARPLDRVLRPVTWTRILVLPEREKDRAGSEREAERERARERARARERESESTCPRTASSGGNTCGCVTSRYERPHIFPKMHGGYGPSRRVRSHISPPGAGALFFVY